MDPEELNQRANKVYPENTEIQYEPDKQEIKNNKANIQCRN